MFSTNTLAYLQFFHSYFSSSLTLRESKLHCLSLTIFSGQSNIFEQGWSLPAKYHTSVKTLEKDKHSRLFCPAISDEEKSFITLTLGINVIKKFYFITDGGTKNKSISLGR